MKQKNNDSEGNNYHCFDNILFFRTSIWISMTIKYICCSIFVSVIVLFGIWFALNIPLNDGWVTDQADIFSDTEESVLESQLQSLEELHTAEIAVLTISSLEWNDITQTAYEVASQWEIGKENINNGMLILIAPNERERRIEVWYGLEWDVPDILAYRLGRQDLVPAFREQQYFEWVTTLIDHLSWAVAGTYEVQDITSTWNTFENFMVWLFVLLMIWFVVGSIMRSILDAQKEFLENWTYKNTSYIGKMNWKWHFGKLNNEDSKIFKEKIKKRISWKSKTTLYQKASFFNMLPWFLFVWFWWLLYLVPLYFLWKWMITSDAIKTLWWNNSWWSWGWWYGWGSFWWWFSGFWWGSFWGGWSSWGW